MKSKMLMAWRDGVKVGMGFGLNTHIPSQKQALNVLHSKVDGGKYDMMYDDRHEYVTVCSEDSEKVTQIVDGIATGKNNWTVEELELKAIYAEAIEIMLKERI
jgi:hypothetical protein